MSRGRPPAAPGTRRTGRPRISTMGALGADGDTPRFDCVVVGSGFGGAVFAARLAARLGPGRLAVLERGPEVQPGEFPETLAEAAEQIRTPAAPLGIFDLRIQRDLDVLVANLLGGGSELYAAVTLEPLPQTFDIRRDPADPASPRAWPRSIDAEALRPYFNRVRQMLEVERWVDGGPAGSAAVRFDPEVAGSWFWGCEDGVDWHTGEPLRDHAGRDVRERAPLHRTTAFDRAATAIGAPARAVPLAINLTRHHDTANSFGAPRSACIGCGNCVTGCNVGAKNSLTANYLPAAVAAGAQIHSGVEVLYLRPSELAGYRWALLTRVRTPDGKVRLVAVHVKVVVLGAGVFGTAGILFGSRRRGLPVPPLLGTRLSGNGDAIGLARRYAPAARRDLSGRGLSGRELRGRRLDEPGPTVTRMADLRDRPGRRHLVQDAVAPAAASGLLARMVGQGGDPNESLILLAMGYDQSLGRLVAREGRVDVRWPASGRDPAQLAARTTMAAMAAAVAGRLVVNPRLGDTHGGTPITVHPLGGAPMGTSIENGVVDDVGRLFRPSGGVHPGCYVVDASVIPTAVGANPSLTIAALAERAAERIIAEDLPRLLDGAPSVRHATAEVD
jgi:cholesterol oxidase